MKNPQPPRVTDEATENIVPDYSETKTFSKYWPQGPSKYGKWGSRAYKALGRKQAKKQPKK
jgi:hypothetical protein